MIRFILVGCLSLLVAACAFSPQQLSINPVVSLEGERYGNSRQVMVTVEDRRATKALGSRGGVYGDTSLLTISNDMADAMSRAAQGKLASQGFVVNGAEDGARLNIVIDSLGYQSSGDPLATEVQLEAVLKAELSMGGDSYTGRYASKAQHRFVMAPSAAKNEVIINALLSSTLDRLFADKKLQAFLSNI